MWFACMISDSVCTMSTLGGSNPGDTTITHDTTGTAAGLLPEKRKRISLEGEEQAGVRKKPRQNSDILVQRTAPEGLDSHRRKQSCLDKDWILKNDQVLVEATQQLEKILSGVGDIRIIASKILSRLSSEEMVLLSCTTTIDREDFSTLSDWQRPGYWFDKKEEEAFCRKFDYIMSEVWDPRDIFDKWEAFYKVLTKSIHLWVTKVCVRGWEADCDIGHCDNLTVIRKLKHQNVHRIYGEEKKAIRDRSGSVTQWDLFSTEGEEILNQRREYESKVAQAFPTIL
ncbi:hypothetical protein DL98DRAFT_577764 [Cadophora sp. DSE1049]|nr:hypothetical protein DL98DRAFT_577764 [Cadophora sp. DSE1049]